MIKGLGPPARGQKENGGFSYKSFAQASTVILMELGIDHQGLHRVRLVKLTKQI